jgi:hypothetical protein
MIFRISQKLNSKINVGTLPTLPLDENPLADWSAHLFIAGRTQYIILSNTQSLYSTMMYGKGITNQSQFVERAFSSIRELMQDSGLEVAYRRSIAPAAGSVQFAKALNRSVTGSMNDLIGHATMWLAEDNRSPHVVSIMLNDILLSALARSKSFPYGKPREAFKALVSEVES